MKKTFILFCVLLSLSTFGQAQFIAVKQGAKLTYIAYDAESGQTGLDSMVVNKVVVKGDLTELSCRDYTAEEYREKLAEIARREEKNKKLIAKGKKPIEYTRNPLANYGEDFHVVYDAKKGITTYVRMNGNEFGVNMDNLLNEEAQKMGKESITLQDLPPEKRAEAEKVLKMMNAEGALCIRLDKHAKAGDAIPDAHMKIKIAFLTMKADLSEGKVLGWEEVKTPAGSFDCLKITYQVKMKILMMSESGKMTEWYADGVGLVKSEEYNKRGKLLSRSTLTAISK